jgi:surface polysaccharide O-acyltransferase-like enzyme
MKSNIELLRVVLFFMVVSIHVTSVCLLDGSGTMNGSITWYYGNLMRLFVAPAVIGFVLISGFLIVNKDFNVKNYLVKLVNPFLIYFPILVISNYIVSEGNFTNRLFSVFHNLNNVVGHFHHLWFIIVLFILSLFIPFINKLLKLCSEKQHRYLMFLLLFTAVINTTSSLLLGIRFFSGLWGSDSRVFLFIALYVTGAYFGKYDFNISKSFLFIGYFLIPVIIFMIGIKGLNGKVFPYVELSNLLIVIQGVILFLFFTKLNFESKLINSLGRLVYGSYIIHVLFISIVQLFLPFTDFIRNDLYPFIDVTFILLVMIFSFLTEMLRMKIRKYMTGFRDVILRST